MLKKPKGKQKTVAEKVAELIAHPNESGSDSESGAEEARARVIDFDEDEYQMPEARTTEFRKRNIKLLSEQSSKYKGKIASRKDFEEEDEEESEDDEGEESEADEQGSEEDDVPVENGNEVSDSDEDDEAIKAFSKALKKKQSKYDEEDEEESDQLEDEEDSDEGEEQEDEDDDSEDDEQDSEDEDEENEVISKVNHEAEIQKGLCVQNQLHVWERLLELRINSQKIISKANQLPAPDEVKSQLSRDEKSKTMAHETTKQVRNLLQSLVSLQDSLFSQYSELSKSIKPCLKRPSPFQEHNSNEGPPLKQVNSYLQDRFESLRTYRNAVLLKWDDRTKLLQPGAGAKKKSMNEEYDIIKKIDNALMNKSMLIEKSQQLKNNQKEDKTDEDAESQEENKDINRNIYDDSDFYHQQLRELIEYKANTSNNMSEVTKQFLELQKLRQKMKKKVDTRASKGRKLRYVVHNKLINFMAPHDNSTWTNESKDELSKSLFV